jgi:hypothetical protein
MGRQGRASPRQDFWCEWIIWLQDRRSEQPRVIGRYFGLSEVQVIREAPYFRGMIRNMSYCVARVYSPPGQLPDP